MKFKIDGFLTGFAINQGGNKNDIFIHYDLSGHVSHNRS